MWGRELLKQFYLLPLLLFSIIIVTYILFSFGHFLLDSRIVHYPKGYQQWMPGQTIPFCERIYEEYSYYQCKVNFADNSYIFIKVDQVTGIIVETTFRYNLGKLSAFIYQYGEPISVHKNGSSWVLHWNNFTIWLYSEYNSDSAVTLVTFY